MDWVSRDVAGILMLLFDIVVNEGRDGGDGYESVDGGDDGYDTNHGEEERQQQQYESNDTVAVDKGCRVSTTTKGAAGETKEEKKPTKIKATTLARERVC